MRRRTFLSPAGALRARAASPRRIGAHDKIVLACMGCRGRAGHLVRGFADRADIEIAALIDVDARQFAASAKYVEEKKGKTPRTLRDFRRALDDPAVDALVVGTPEHGHALPTILACQAGEQVYVEKPLAHNHREGQEEGAAVYGDNGYVVIGNRDWRAYDANGKELEVGSPQREDDPRHKQDWVDATGHVASLRIHLGNIAWRTGRRLRWDADRPALCGRRSG